MELDYVFHPDHKLSYSKSVKRGEKAEECAACRDEISSEHYSCFQCNFFIHKLCAERPLELSHSLHPLHPLRLISKSTSDGACDACKKRIEGFIYQCAICDFDLDIICAFPDGLKMNSIFHLEHVLTFEKEVKVSDKKLVCGLCFDEISGKSAEHYSCRRCNVFLHKLCSETPVELTHSSHIHPLQLIPENPFSNEDATCNACYGILNGLLYHCKLCNKFTIHLGCAVPTLKPDYSVLNGGSKLNHLCHSHILTLEKVVKTADKGLLCAACLEGISGPLADYYSCRKCHFFLHQVCGERPQELIHPLHPKQIHLQMPPNIQGTFVCSSCLKPMKGFVYRCHSCKFYLDFKCSLSKTEKRIQNLEHVHHHPLIYFPRASKISCDICSSAAGDEAEEEQSYACSTCDFMIHKSCALTDLTQQYKEHEHPLSLVQGVTEDLRMYGRFRCDVCHKTITPEDPVAHCARCRYFVHTRCMITGDTGFINTIKDAVDYLDDSLIQLFLSGDEFVRWPRSDVSSDLILPFLLGKNDIVMNVEPKIRHFSHKEHDMILFQELCVNNDSFFKEEDEEILCDACNHPITAPYYCCQGCEYYLHLPCANLPSKISHSSHPHHELALINQSRCFYNFRCGRCKYLCNGFAYRCEPCEFSLDLTCAALPAVIMHESHEHPLIQTKHELEGLCYCCYKYVGDGDGVFKCRSCDVYLHYNCAMYSRSIRHRWDRQHPLELRYPPHADHPEHIMCDVCEVLVNTIAFASNARCPFILDAPPSTRNMLI